MYTIHTHSLPIHSIHTIPIHLVHLYTAYSILCTHIILHELIITYYILYYTHTIHTHTYTIYRGELIDPYNEFMIQSDDRLSHDTLAQDFNAHYWEAKFTLHTKHIPVFLQVRIMLCISIYSAVL